MTLEIKHVFESVKGDGPDATLVQPSDWNALHTSVMGEGLAGNPGPGSGPVVEIPIGAGLGFEAGALISTIPAFPVGVLLPLAGNIEPPGWLICDGRAVSRTTYAELFNLTSDKFGVGDGITTFNIPDMRGRIPAGKDNMGGTAANRLTSVTIPGGATDIGRIGGTERHVLTAAQLAIHTHIASGGAHRHLVATTDNPATSSPSINSSQSIARQNLPTNNFAYNLEGYETEPTVARTSSAGVAPTIANTGADEPHLNLQPTIIMSFIIWTGVIL